MGKEEATPLLRKSEVAPLEDDDAFCVELKRVGSMAAPMLAANMCQYLLQVVSLMMVGHLGVLVSFSGVAIATSFAEVTGFCVLVKSSFISSLFLFHAPACICFSPLSGSLIRKLSLIDSVI